MKVKPIKTEITLTTITPIKRVVYFGTPEFAVPPLERLINSKFKPLLVVTQPDRQQGRKLKLMPPPVKVLAQEHSIEVAQPESLKEPSIIAKLTELKPDIIVTAAYGGFLTKNILELPRLGCVNLHPSLLPKYRGATPINKALFEGDTITGNTIFKMTPRMDDGPILLQKKLHIDEKDNYTTLSDKLSLEGGDLLLELLERLEKSEITPVEQNDKEASYCYKINKSDTIIDWALDAKEIQRLVRGLALIPGAVTTFRERPLKIMEVEPVELDSGQPAGTIIEIEKTKDGGFIVACGKDSLKIKQVQAAGKRIMGSFEYNLGARLEIGERLG
ncbi:MAG: methionyl-tRNA formyltransferase [Candidatus Cloacimonas sp.]|nr:methionyl-tRNA formyltransferase [Candidatus Cloacimonadota bacterium]